MVYHSLHCRAIQLTHPLERFQVSEDESLGKNKWLPSQLQWVLAGILVVSIVLGLALLPEPGELSMMTLGFCILLLGVAFTMFFGLVSMCLPLNYILDGLTDLLLVAVFAKLRVVIPYLIGCFAALFFLLPVQAATKKGLVSYDYAWYSLNVLWTTGGSNGFTAVMAQRHWISLKARWVGQSLGWPVFMSALVIVPLLSGVKMEAYKLTLAETFRYSIFQATVYICIYFGFCGHLEQILPKETEPLGADVSNTKVIFFGVALVLHFIFSGLGIRWLGLLSFWLLLLSSTLVVDAGSEDALIIVIFAVTLVLGAILYNVHASAHSATNP